MKKITNYKIIYAESPDILSEKVRVQILEYDYQPFGSPYSTPNSLKGHNNCQAVVKYLDKFVIDQSKIIESKPIMVKKDGTEGSSTSSDIK